MDLNVAKGMALAVLLIVPIAFGFLSLYLINKYRIKLLKSRQGQGFLSYLNCFSGGVFLGTCLLLVLRQGKHTFEEYKKHNDFTSKFPFFELGIGFGFFLVALMEKLIHLLFGHSHELSPDTQDDRTSEILDMVPIMTESELHLYEDMEDSDAASTQKILNSPGSVESPNTNTAAAQKHSKESTQTSVKPQTEPDSESTQSSHTEESQSFLSNPESPKQDGCRKLDTTHAPSRACQEVVGKCGKSESNCSDTAASFSHLRVLVLVLALSFHTVFDGLTVGIQTDQTTVLTLLAVVIVHKIIMATVLGVELGTTMINQKLARPFIMLILFALTTPVGVAIGIGVTSGRVNKDAQLLTESVLMSVSTGAFLYVTCFESLEPGLARRKERSVLRVLVAVSGFLVVACVEAIAS